MITVPMAEEEHEIPYDFRRYTEIGLKSYLGKYGFECMESGKLNSWKNSMRILNIAKLCKDKNNNLILKIRRKLYIVFCNFCRMMFGNKVKKDQLFSNKVYFIGRKVSGNGA